MPQLQVLILMLRLGKIKVVCGVHLDENNEVSYGYKDDTTCQNIWS